MIIVFSIVFSSVDDFNLIFKKQSEKLKHYEVEHCKNWRRTDGHHDDRTVSECFPCRWPEINKWNCNPELLTNKRGISLTSNVDKVFERILNARVIQNLPFSEVQAGGRPNRSTVDQIFTLKEVVKQRSSEIKPTYCAFIDI